ncbi:MAG: hypothetical protein LPK19_06975 [Hymenobacteraceae bacterium]|nr:hypothetical protein [Hymenobacteraceae bacterium]MDX5395945.1 hypothetical protein [Hymenobacteraceae bacterium]MDX5512003.1 hypothetical protein [Hymenobacteraceae bacterium]
MNFYTHTALAGNDAVAFAGTTRAAGITPNPLLFAWQKPALVAAPDEDYDDDDYDDDDSVFDEEYGVDDDDLDDSKFKDEDFDVDFDDDFDDDDEFSNVDDEDDDDDFNDW